MSTDISEKGLESLIVRHMTGTDGLVVAPNTAAEPPAPYGGTGYFAGSPKDFDRAHALDVAQLGREPGQELQTVDVLRVIGIGDAQLLEGIGLRGAQEGEELDHVERVSTVEVLRAAGEVAGAAVGRGWLGGCVGR